MGTPVSNLTHLINLEYTEVPILHLPYPQIHPYLPWKPEGDLGGPREITETLHDLSTFPAKDIRDEMINAYFDKINPYFPIVDEADFRKRYADQSKPPALLLFQSILLAGAHVCDHPKVVQSRSVVKTVLFRRAQALFDMRHENDRLHLIQAALIFTWYLENDDTVSANSYYWAGVACRMAFGLGCHRDLSPRKPTMMPPQDRAIYRRVWWTLFQVEIWTALEHGRPSMIHLDDIDQPGLAIEDFVEDGALNTKLDFGYCSRNIGLCYMILEILRLNRPRAINGQTLPDLSSLNSRLASWMLAVPKSNDFGSLQLQLHYHTALIHLHRSFVNDIAAHSNEICNGAASAILSIFETMVTGKTIAQCGFTSVISLLAAAIHFSKGIKAAFDSGSALLALSVQAQLERLLQVAAELAMYWPNAEAVYKLFQSLLRKFRTLTSEQLDGTRSVSEAIDTIDWHEILLYPMSSIQDGGAGVREEDWMNVISDMGMGA
jgi:transcriptional regulatory protein AMDR